ncbi:TIGR02679 domain-containing protein, partial [Kitasatospora sp. NPDC091257]
MTTCPLCPGACQGATLAPLTCPQLTWLWERVALRADATADDLTRGSLAITLPDSPELLAAAGTLLSNRPLLAGRRIRVDLPRLTGLLRTRGPLLTPAAVAAHALERRVGEPSLERQRTAQRRQQITALANDLLGALPRSCPVRPSPQAAVEVLRYKGWIARLSLRPDGELLLRQAVTTLQSLPTAGSVVDRRHLAQDATGHPKSLDRGHPLARLVLALTEAAGHT